ncbi:MAG: hypothetical protein H0V49_12980, partial [Nocardioidaceae bacterium]|nr:hypothetical protein [Nocardioidaceae bacterium]
MSVTTILRLRCECGRNLADVARNRTAMPHHNTQIRVSARAGTEVTEYVPGGRSRGGYAVFDPLVQTYSFKCRCGRKHDRRTDALFAYWQL